MISGQSPSPWVVLPIESNARELQARVLLGAAAATRGFRVLIVRREDLGHVLPIVPHCVVLHTTVIDDAPARFARSLGHVVVALDEEGLVYRSPAEYASRRITCATLREVARFFAWGDAQAEIVRQHCPAARESVLVTGNPRLDLLRPELRDVHSPEARELRRRYGDFVLINTNFGKANHFLGRAAVEEHWEAKGWRAGGGSHLLGRIIDLQERLMAAFVEAISDLAPAIWPVRIVLRPHPSEDLQEWRRRLSGHPNVEVIFEGSAIPWIAAARMLVHNGCTTGIESVLLGRPALAYQPFADPEVEADLPNQVSESIRSVSQLIGRVKQLLDKPEDVLVDHALLRHHVTGFSGSRAADRMAEEMAVVSPSQSRSRDLRWFRPKLGMRRMVARCRGMVASALRGRLGEEIRTVGYYRRASPSVTSEEVAMHLDRIAEVLPDVAEFAVGQLAGDVVLVDPRGNRGG